MENLRDIHLVIWSYLYIFVFLETNFLIFRGVINVIDA